jgi:hypothetical protein
LQKNTHEGEGKNVIHVSFFFSSLNFFYASFDELFLAVYLSIESLSKALLNFSSIETRKDVSPKDRISYKKASFFTSAYLCVRWIRKKRNIYHLWTHAFELFSYHVKGAQNEVNDMQNLWDTTSFPDANYHVIFHIMLQRRGVLEEKSEWKGTFWKFFVSLACRCIFSTFTNPKKASQFSVSPVYDIKYWF